MIQEYKGVGVRFGAQIIDGIAIFTIFILLIRITPYFTDILSSLFWVYDQLIVFATIEFLYFFLLEGFFGITLGKKAFKIRVVMEDGAQCRLVPSLIRNILRIIDVLPFLYIIGVILISRSSRKQRLGDVVAHTIVIGTSSIFTPIPSTLLTDTATSSADVAAKEGKKFCINCRSKIPQEAIFCPKCGAKE